MKSDRKLLCSSGTTEGAEKLLNQYYYSTTFRIEDSNVFNSKGQVKSLEVEISKKRIKIYQS